MDQSLSSSSSIEEEGVIAADDVFFFSSSSESCSSIPKGNFLIRSSTALAVLKKIRIARTSMAVQLSLIALMVHGSLIVGEHNTLKVFRAGVPWRCAFRHRPLFRAGI